jgi:hypothetical protein
MAAFNFNHIKYSKIKMEYVFVMLILASLP